ncbi:UNVERIFIED_CONTAM: Ankyrin repeat protein SKIP35 [Sesamum angustifolium]|uniref:Ankyrin repeat protein SKIP35 n=1 Tax=Sesamum angustifolium TaxID=2727405 RepID=A0AAW2PTW5_9LAMI
MPVVEWFVQRGCRDMELCLALTAATSSSQVEVAAHLLPHVPQHVLAALSIEILKAAGERSGRSLEGVSFLLRSDFLCDPAATYSVADSIARSNDEAVAPELKAFLQEHWSEAAFLDGLRQGEAHSQPGADSKIQPISNLFTGSPWPVEGGNCLSATVQGVHRGWRQLVITKASGPAC